MCSRGQRGVTPKKKSTPPEAAVQGEFHTQLSLATCDKRCRGGGGRPTITHIFTQTVVARCCRKEKAVMR